MDRHARITSGLVVLGIALAAALATASGNAGAQSVPNNPPQFPTATPTVSPPPTAPTAEAPPASPIEVPDLPSGGQAGLNQNPSALPSAGMGNASAGDSWHRVLGGMAVVLIFAAAGCALLAPRLRTLK